MSNPANEALLESWSLSLHQRSERTQELYLRETRRFADWLEAEGKPLLTDATKGDIERWIRDQQRRKLNGNTIRSRYYCVRVFFGWALDESEVETNPTDRITVGRGPDKAPKPLSDDELRRLFATCEGARFKDRRDMAILRLLVATGMRTAELVGIEPEDLDLQSRLVVLRVTKGDKPRMSRFDPATAASLDRYRRVRARHKHATAPGFWLGERGRLTLDGPPWICQQRGEAAGIPDLHPHRLRHTFADRWYDAGGEEGDLQRLGGWDSAEMARKYGRARAVDRALSSYDRIDPMKGI